MWVVKVKGYSSEPEEEAMKLLEGYIINAADKHFLEGFEADDIAQELRLHLWKKMHLYNPTMGPLETWGYRVIVNRIRDLAKKKDPLCNPHFSYEDEYEKEE